jgi:hypothetical protein
MALYDNVPYPSVIVVTAVLVAYIVAGAVYRLYFSPVAKFPGPKLAALSFWCVAIHQSFYYGAATPT